jgi:phosphatidylinositol kinase/protein kinase (PI-3  family)
MTIFTYSITPLSPTAGLIQFVNGADTMFSLIGEYRKRRDVPVFLEQELIEQVAIRHFDLLLPIHRLEAFESAVSGSSDEDLRETLWLSSPSAIEWIARSLRFTRSSAVMSIIGYILGLGDRHPSNLMIHRFTGSVIHIDFSDCFEVNRNRIRFPELVPFRLTRMIRRSFGPIGIEGEFRRTCEQTVTLIRAHRESISAVLDIFLQEPLEIREDSGDGPAIDLAFDVENLSAVGDSEERAGSTNIQEALGRIMSKITGTDFEDQAEMSVEGQVDALFAQATDLYRLAKLYHGWTPLW